MISLTSYDLVKVLHLLLDNTVFRNALLCNSDQDAPLPLIVTTWHCAKPWGNIGLFENFAKNLWILYMFAIDANAIFVSFYSNFLKGI